MSRDKLHKELQPVAKAARRQNWTWRVNGGTHIEWKGPNGQTVITPNSPGRGRSMWNTFAKLKRAGLVLTSRS